MRVYQPLAGKCELCVSLRACHRVQGVIPKSPTAVTRSLLNTMSSPPLPSSMFSSMSPGVCTDSMSCPVCPVIWPVMIDESLPSRVPCRIGLTDSIGEFAHQNLPGGVCQVAIASQELSHVTPCVFVLQTRRRCASNLRTMCYTVSMHSKESTCVSEDVWSCVFVQCSSQNLCKLT